MSQSPPTPEFTDSAGRLWVWDPELIAYRNDNPAGTWLADAADIVTAKRQDHPSPR